MNLVFKNYFNIFTLFLPILFVYIPSIFFPINNSGSNIPFRPPPITFAIVWPILLILVGISWFNRTNLSIYYLILSILLGAWTIFYNYSNIASFIEIIITLLFTLFLILYKFENLSSILLIPLALWLSFASILNGYEILN
jgi:tryptophan-rich sensory protein